MIRESTLMKYDELEKLARLRDSGILTEEEFQKEKAKLLSDSTVFTQFSAESPLFGIQENHYCALIHFSQFLSYIIPILGLVVPITLWIIGKKTSEKADIAGRNSFDWMISALIYATASILLICFIVGIPFLIAVVICAVVFPIVAGTKALDGETWRYPLSFHFFTEKPQSPNSSGSSKREYSSKPDKDAHFSKRKYD